MNTPRPFLCPFAAAAAVACQEEQNIPAHNLQFSRATTFSLDTSS